MEQGSETVRLSGKTQGLPGIPLAELSQDERGHVRKVMADLLAPFRKADADEALIYIEAAGFEHLHMAFFQQEDIGNDKTWDIWRVEGPSFVWHFRGAPHVHAYINIGLVKKA